MAWTSETAKQASDRGHASMTPEQRRARAQKASRAAAIRTAYVLVTKTPEVFTTEQRAAMARALDSHRSTETERTTP